MSTIFGDLEFCVVNGLREFSKEDMERKITEVVEIDGRLAQAESEM